MTLDMLNVMLAVGEEGMIDEMLLALLAAPQLAVFFDLKRPISPPSWMRRFSVISNHSGFLPRSLSSSFRKF